MTSISAVMAMATLPPLAGCSSNTVFDDNAYRSIGGSAPRPAPISAPLSSAAEEYAPENSGSFVSGMAQSSATSNAPAGHLVRYGHPGIIDKIVKTARIHCQPFTTKIETDKHSYWGESQGYLKQCTYQFPAHCGAHTFAVIEYANKLALAYLEKDSTYYVIDLLKGTPAAKPGLWDKDDRIGSKANNMGYMLENNYNTNFQMREQAPLHLGWIIKASYDDETAHGKLYHQAITDIVQCF